MILTLNDYKNHPFLNEQLWDKLEKVIPYKVVIERLPNIESIRERISAKPVRAHLLFLERKDLLQLENYFAGFNDFSSELLDQLDTNFTLEPKGKYFPIFWENQFCGSPALVSKDIKIWGLAMPHVSRRAGKKSLLFVNDLVNNPIAYKILQLTPNHLTFKKADNNNSVRILSDLIMRGF